MLEQERDALDSFLYLGRISLGSSEIWGDAEKMRMRRKWGDLGDLPEREMRGSFIVV